ncbi:hypothetical protein M405DRAFT_847316 [Rhizopogon salebrosus TDB-379]|nr:hypothetical protein M405DRAFT_847316 [Rhizopogon salebrosus TDB-379]
MTPIQDGGGTDTELFLSELSSSPDQDATIQFSHERFVPPDSLNPEPCDHHPEIAPFLNIEQPSASPRLIKRSLGLSKASFSSFASSRQGSSSNILYPYRSGVDSEIISDYNPTLSDMSLRSRGSSVDLRKGMRMIFADILKKPRSRGRLSSDTASTSHQSSLASLSTDTFTFMNPISSSPPPLVPKKDKKEKGWQLKGRAPSNASPTTTVTPLAHQDGEWKVDFVMSDLDQMDGIVKPLPDPKDAVPSNGHPSSPVDSSTSSTFCNSLQQPPSPPPSSTVVFNNPHPFSSTSPVNKPNGVGDIPKLSPKSTPLLIAQEESGPSRMAADGPVPPIWTAPESWAVEKDEEEQADAGGASSSEESTNISTRYTDAMSSLSSADPTSRRKSRRKTIHLRKISPRNNTDRVRVRIYLAHAARRNFNCNLKYLNLSGNKKLNLKQNNCGKGVV